MPHEPLAVREDMPPLRIPELAEAEDLITEIEIEIVDPGFDAVIMEGAAGGFHTQPGTMQLTQEWRGGDAALSVLKDLRQVNFLTIDQAKLTDAAFAHIGNMQELHHIQLHGTKFSLAAMLKFHQEHPQVSFMAMGEAMLGVNSDFHSTPCTLTTVSPQTAAAQAGLQAGDVIQKLDGREIRDFSELTMHVYSHKPGDELQVVYQRGTETREVKVKLQPRH